MQMQTVFYFDVGVYDTHNFALYDLALPLCEHTNVCYFPLVPLLLLVLLFIIVYCVSVYLLRTPISNNCLILTTSRRRSGKRSSQAQKKKQEPYPNRKVFMYWL